MTIVLGLLLEIDKGSSLRETTRRVRDGALDRRIYDVLPESFKQIPGAPFSYWVTDKLRTVFSRIKPFESQGRIAKLGTSSKNDFRFLRVWWEDVVDPETTNEWQYFAKGGAYSQFYADVYLLIRWGSEACELEADLLRKFPYLGTNADFVLHRSNPYGSPGLTWSQRSQKGLSMRALPAGCVFAAKGPAAFLEGTEEQLLALLALTNSSCFRFLVSLQIAFGSYNVQTIQNTPVPDIPHELLSGISLLARQSWSFKRVLDTQEEVSHAFVLPDLLYSRLGGIDRSTLEGELARIQKEIDDIAFGLYGFDEAERFVISNPIGTLVDVDDADEAEEDDDSDFGSLVDARSGLLSWAIGVAFGRFDWRLATGERQAPPEPDPFDPLPVKSPGMLPDGATPFHAYAGILVDDQGHPHDLARLVEEVLARVEVTVPDDVRRWLQREFFAFHLQRYSKSRRKAPIYWPLSTTSGSYTLWVYYPSLTSQTLYTAINDIIAPKLKQVGADVTALRNKGTARSREDEKQFESLQAFELELIELRDTLLKLAPTYKPDHDDGVQISAAPLWPLFRHKPWQKVLKDTWAKLEKGDYDWAHLAMNYWPERVREKCRTDKSLAIAHCLEDLYVEPEAKPKKARGKKKAGDDE
jgi:hypothetical protein